MVLYVMVSSWTDVHSKRDDTEGGRKMSVTSVISKARDMSSF